MGHWYVVVCVFRLKGWYGRVFFPSAPIFSVYELLKNCNSIIDDFIIDIRSVLALTGLVRHDTI
ncbi:hypothetical protein BpHYR1_025443 [Brachionus plicatilis]|uniref:Uncharacterized protein n=1 Tax=Brachionus plicatilis TaxID=10195 RepID=A0A3M7P7Q4_BRAPC|nr:hypothetical protein BpHYR1_025443 [Brachionus plicatilis]